MPLCTESTLNQTNRRRAHLPCDNSLVGFDLFFRLLRPQLRQGDKVLLRGRRLGFDICPHGSSRVQRVQKPCGHQQTQRKGVFESTNQVQNCGEKQT